MNLRLSTILATVTLAATLSAHAGTPVLGVEIGVTTVSQLQQSLGKKTRLEKRGVNKWSGGEMLSTDGSAHGIEGLNSVLYIFDPEQKLAGVVMDMGKHKFDTVYKALSAKYKVVSQQRPFVGDQFARFKPADAVIEVDAPHMSFEMEVRYMRNDFQKRFATQSLAEQAAQQQSETSQF